MKNLAIRGHETRGKEVIEILEMLGGKNIYNYDGKRNMLYILKDDTIVTDFILNKEKGFTLEEFLENFPYKVGDKVSVCEYETKVRIDDMKWDGFEIQYLVFTDETEWYSAEELNKYNEPYKEEIMEEKKDIALAPDLKGEDYSDRRIGYKIPNGYECECVTKNEIILKPIKPQYPKNYKECCEVLGIGSYFEPEIRNATTEECRKFMAFMRLRRCISAYWKIAGEQMGLGKSWEPDWENCNENKYCLYITRNNVNKGTFCCDNRILAFPTEEMRDTFYENFQDLIESCKELL